MIERIAFVIYGEVNSTVFDDGLESTADEPKRLKAIVLTTSEPVGNMIEVYLERKRIEQLYDYHLDTIASGSTVPLSMTKLNKIELDCDIPVGHRLKTGLKCGGTANNLFGYYEFEVTKVR